MLAAILNLIIRNYFKIIASKVRKCSILIHSMRKRCFSLFFSFFFCLCILQVAKYSVTPYPVMLKLMSTEIPMISLQKDSFTVQIQGSMEVLAVLPDSSIQSLFTLNIVSKTNKVTFNSGLNMFVPSFC